MTARTVAGLAIELGLDPAGLVASPPSVFDALLELADEIRARRRLDELAARLRGRR